MPDNVITDRTEAMGRLIFNRSPSDCHSKNICVSCGKEALHFKDDFSRDNYNHIVMCQECQDSIFE